MEADHAHSRRLTLCVATRDRHELFSRYVLPCLRHLPQSVDAIVIDQSTSDRTRAQTEGLERVQYRRMCTVGLSRARNLAVAETTAPMLAFTDDDVTFSREWLERIIALFDAHSDAGAVCGRAVTPDGQPVLGGVTKAGVFRWPASPFGLGAGLNMAFRREALAAVGPFDEELGAGAAYPSAEDTDMLYRVLRAGWNVVCSDELVVTHHEWRSGREQLRLHFRYGVGIGAQTAKHVAAGDREAAWMALRLQAHLPRTLLLLRPRYGLRHLLFSAGMAAGFVRRRRAHRPLGARRTRRHS